ncbi:DUF1488 family protein [Paraburkholderia caribensis]|uniref:DUF1488 family protein n=1 Tax=Paraburkholderia caribensis TaxID=75105 RepID=UPI0007202C6C|nr:DUF1488 family protein [Paraburkholderia caribensis]ALP68660.1 hypothetical protein AN416_38865 [Paraburkholderia caribensis]AUT58136.1 DUF1488 domain-containing protein [Paraburkholderia caribensis]
METIESEPQVTANRRGVAFTLVHQGRPVECVVTTAALEAWFWLEPRATEARMLKTFSDGYRRIRAIAERRLLAHPATTLELTPEDFARP